MYSFYTGSSRTGLFRALRKAFQRAILAKQSGAHPSDEWLDVQFEKATLSRRHFLRYSAKAGLVMGTADLLESPAKPFFPPVDSRKRSARIAIVGGGIAGLNCAYQLKKKGQIARIYEASNRAGGRMYSVKDLLAPGLTTEIGGEFIDSNHDDILNLAKEFSLPLLDMHDPSEGAYSERFFFGGQFYTQKDLINAFQPMVERVRSDQTKLPGHLHGNVAVNAFDQLSIAQYFDTIGLSGWVRQLLEVAYLTEFGTAVDEQSAVNFLSMFLPEVKKMPHSDGIPLFGDSDEQYKIVGGNQKITDALYEQVKDQVLLEQKLTAIKGAEEGPYTLTFETKGSTPIDVTCDVLVLTLPFTTLRQVDFRVPLPDWKMNAIQNLNYGTNAKLLLGFQERVWRAQQSSGALFSDTHIQLGWDNSQLQAGTAGGYTVYFGGQAGVAVGDGTPTEQAERYLTALEKVWPGSQAKFNGQAHRMHWPTHPHTLGSYSCYKVGQWSTLAGNEGKPVHNIYFAGEHCSLGSQGYMNGGAETGRITAEIILADKRNKKMKLR